MTSESQKALGDHLRRRLPSAAEEQVALDRVWSDLQHEGDAVPAHVEANQVRRGRIPRMALAAAAVVVLAAAIGTAILWPRGNDALYRVVDGVVQAGGTIQTNGGGAQLTLVDGSRVEMRSQSELSLERADDGLRIRLDKGGIIVNAAPQRPGHLYVQTKDVTVSVVGTVFLVNATEDGSRVAVIEGEVHVQQGATKTTLLPGQQVATNPSIDARPVREAIAWSRHAPALLTLLQQSAVVPPAITGAQSATVPVDAFEVASIRPSAAPAGGGRGGGGGRGPDLPACTGPAVPLRLEIDPRRFAAYSATLHALVMGAYGKNCLLVSGGPDWAASDRYDVEAVIPENSGSYTVQQFRNGEAPKLQGMLQTLLADRFRLSLRREMKEIDVFNLVVVAAGKLKPGVGPRNEVPWGSRTIPTLQARTTTMAFAEVLTKLLGRTVIDRTELTGPFDIHLEWEPAPPGAALEQSAIFSAIQQQLGLKLEAARVPMETLVIERAERPSEN